VGKNLQQHLCRLTDVELEKSVPEYITGFDQAYKML